MATTKTEWGEFPVEMTNMTKPQSMHEMMELIVKENLTARLKYGEKLTRRQSDVLLFLYAKHGHPSDDD